MKQTKESLKSPLLSKERVLWLKQHRRQSISVKLWQWGLLVSLLLLWELAARLGWVDAFLVSQPSRIVSTLLDTSQNGLLHHVGVTLYETLTGFFLGVFLGLSISILCWWSPFVSRVAEPYLVVLNSLPKIALGPVII